MGSLSIFLPSMFLSGDSHEDTNGASSSLFFVSFLLRWINFKSRCYHISSCCFTYLPMWISYPRLYYLFTSPSSYPECWRYLGRFVLPFSICSSYFEVVISFKPFNSTGAIPPFNQLFNGVYFEWALTHRSFSRIIPDSSNFSGVILKFISKFDVRMNFHQSHAFSKVVFKFFSSLAQPFLF